MKRVLLIVSLFSMSISTIYAQQIDCQYLNPRMVSPLYSFLRFGTASAYYAGFMFNNTNPEYGNGNDFTIFTYDNRDIAFNSGTGNVVFSPLGTSKVGIGTTTPISDFHIKKYINSSSVAYPEIRLEGYNNYMGSPHYVHWVIAQASAGNNSENNLEFKLGTTNSPSSSTTLSTKAVLNMSGLLVQKFSDMDNNSYYLDPSNTSISLKVAGNIQTCGKVEAEVIEVKNVCAANINVKMDNLADYVFDKDYDLLSLEEVKAYIQQNGHLNNIPSADEVQEKGMNVAQMNNLLLQKVEELTLYILDIEKRLKEVENNK